MADRRLSTADQAQYLSSPSTSSAPSSIPLYSAVQQDTAEAKPDSRPKEDKKPACSGCRQIKVKCGLPPGAPDKSTCTRCLRLRLDCTYPAPQARGRRPRPRSDFGSEENIAVGGMPGPSHSNGYSEIFPLPGTSQDSSSAPRSGPFPLLPHYSGATTHQLSLGHLPPPIAAPANVSSPGTGGHAHLSPSTTLSNSSATQSQNTTFDNSLRYLVEEGERKAASANDRVAAPPPHVKSNPSYPDPVDLHVLGMLEAEQLFNLFHENLNPFIKLFDKRLHTAAWCRQISAVLFTAMLAVSAKFHRPDIYQTLLAAAQQLVTRGIADALNHIGLVQALCVLVYWKEPTDGTSWIKVGFAIRLGYQLRLHARRQTPLPTDELEARLILNNERTWLNLCCFDASYRFHFDDDSDSQLVARMASPHGLRLDRWLSESLMYDCPDDALLCASIECGKVHTLCASIEASNSLIAAEALVTHCDAMVREAYVKYFEPDSAGPLRPAAQKMRFVYLWASTCIAKAHVKVTNMEDSMVVAEFLRRAGESVACAVENADSGLMLYLQDSMSVMLFRLAEALVRTFPAVKSNSQATIVLYLTTIYRACNAAKKGDEHNCCAYISRYYKACIRALSLNLSGPPSRAPSPGPAGNVRNGGDVKAENGNDATFNPFASAEMNDIFAGFSPDNNLNPLTDSVDTAYWENLFPGQTVDNWTWLSLQNSSTGSPAPDSNGQMRQQQQQQLPNGLTSTSQF